MTAAKRRRPLVAGAILALVLAPTSFAVGVGAFGICPGEMRARTDAELVAAAAHHAVDLQSQSFRASSARRLNEASSFEPYRTANDLLSANPACCRVVRLPAAWGDGIDAPPMLARIMGELPKLVVVDYDERIVESDGSRLTLRQKFVFHPTVCGQPSGRRF